MRNMITELEAVSRRSVARFNYNAALRKAEELDEIAEEIRRIVTEMQELSDSSHSHWNGDASDRYFSRLYNTLEGMTAVITNYSKTAETIRTTAQRLYNMEMEAIEIARQRSYGGST